MPRAGDDSAENRRIDSWKEIATFFGRDERTVKRWEKERSLPIHRIPGGERGGVFAYTHELTQWMNTPRNAATPGQPPSQSPLEKLTEPQLRQPSEPTPPTADRIDSPKTARRAWILGFAALAAVALSVFFVIRLAHPHTHSVPPQPVAADASIRSLQNAGAQDSYLRGRYYWNRRTGDSLNHAVDEFTQAIVHDPSDARAYAGLADTYNLMREYTSMPASQAYPRAIAAARKAVALDPSLPEAHRALAFALFNWQWDVPDALREYQAAIQLNPNDAEAHHWYATALLNLGRNRQALSEIELARRLEPSSFSILADRGLILYEAGDHLHAIASLRELEQTEPQFLSPPRYLARLFFLQKDDPNFIAQLERAASISKDPQEHAIAAAARHGWSVGGERGMLRQMALAQQAAFDSGKASGFDLAVTNLLLGRKNSAVRYLQAAYAARDPNVFSIVRDPAWAPLQGDPAFERMKAGLLKYQG